MTGHLDLDALADLLAGEGDDAQVDHLAGCGTCSAALVDLEQASTEVSAALAALPAPQVPEGLAARLDAALRAERRDEAARGPAAGLPPLPLGDEDDQPALRAVPRLDDRRADARRRRPLLLGAAAAAAAVVLGGTAITAALQRGPGSDSPAATAGSAAQGSAEGGAPQAEAPAVADRSGAEYGPGAAGLGAALPRLLGADRPTRAAAPGEAAPDGTPDGELDRLRDPAALAACLSALPGPASTPLALDYARYDGSPALVVVRPSVDAGSVEVAVVGPQCRAGAPDALLLTRLPRPS